MKKIAMIAIIGLALGCVPLASAQNHGEVGAFANYLRLQSPTTNHYGLGGRLSVNVHPNIQLEAEMSYDFSRGFNETFTSAGTSGTATVNRSNLRILDGLFGPKLQTGGQAIRAFLTVKGGFINFRFDPRPATFGAFTSDVDSLRRSNVDGVVYPGGGVELYAGIIGVRVDVGDEIYFNNGAHNNLRVAAGPSFRF